MVGGAGANPNCHRVRGRVHLGHVASMSHGQHRETQPFTLTVNLESNNLTLCMFLDFVRKPQDPGKRCEELVSESRFGVRSSVKFTNLETCKNTGHVTVCRRYTCFVSPSDLCISERI